MWSKTPHFIINKINKEDKITTTIQSQEVINNCHKSNIDFVQWYNDRMRYIERQNKIARDRLKLN